MNEDNGLIHDCLREPFDGIGKPDPLNENLSGSGSWPAEAGEITTSPPFEHQALPRIERGRR